MHDKTKVFITNKQEVIQKVIANFSGVIRNDTMAGRDYIVAPMVMIVEGVLPGSCGPLLYPANELSQMPAIWNSKPVVVYHPETNTACSPEEIDARGIGQIMNAKFEGGKLKAEAWLEKNRMSEVDDRVLNAIENEEMMELSTGLFCEVDNTPGEFNGVAYDGVVKNIRPDHLAVLPDQIGACSKADGAGFIRLNSRGVETDITFYGLKEDEIRYITKNKKFIFKQIRHNISNELSHDDIRSMIWSLLDDIYPNAWVEDVFDGFFIYVIDGAFFRQGFSEQESKIVLVGEREEVVKVTEFRKTDGTVINLESNINRKDVKMDKKTIVDGLIANQGTQWTEEHREMLMNMEDGALSLMSPVENKTEDKQEEAQAEDATETETDEVDAETVENKVITADEYINNAPKEVRGMLENAMNSYEGQKTALIKRIVDNEKNVFSEEQLKGKDLQELQNIALLAATTKEEVTEIKKNDYSAQGEVSRAVSNIQPLGQTDHSQKK